MIHLQYQLYLESLTTNNIGDILSKKSQFSTDVEDGLVNTDTLATDLQPTFIIGNATITVAGKTSKYLARGDVCLR